MQKIGLISFQFWYNYGTCLQAYALWKKIQLMGFDSEYIDFGWHYPMPERKDSVTSKIKCKVRKILGLDKLEKQVRKNNEDNNKLFDAFRRGYIKESNLIDILKLSSIENDYSKFIVGSDQTWNPDNVEEEFFKIFLLSFVHSSEKKCAYAPSIGRNNVTTHCLDLYKQYLNDFSYISCRESSGCKILNEALGRNIQQVLDPTLLLEPGDWTSIAENPLKDEGYILCYILGNKTCICKYAQKLAQKENKKLYIISRNLDVYKSFGDYILQGVGPQEFVGLIRDCSCMVTDSFHGTIFSINFQKDFYTFHKRPGSQNESDNSRILDTLKQFGLEERFRNDTDESFCPHINYKSATSILEEYRKKSVAYLSNILNE